jgi:hypothetical protein
VQNWQRGCVMDFNIHGPRNLPPSSAKKVADKADGV